VTQCNFVVIYEISHKKKKSVSCVCTFTFFEDFFFQPDDGPVKKLKQSCYRPGVAQRVPGS